MRREDVASGLSPARLSALSVLVFGGPRTVGALADAEQVRSPTMSRLISEMEAEGLVERVPAAEGEDRRMVTVRPTAKGRRVLQAGRRRRVRTLAAQLQTLQPDEVALLDRAAELMERVASAVR